MENGRRYFHYGTRLPETFGTAVFSAKYAVGSGQWQDVALQVFHHPPHRADVDLDAAAFTVNVPANAQPLSLDGLRASGPLRDSQ